MSAGRPIAEIVPAADLSKVEAAWRALSGRAAEVNVFAEFDFVAPALRRLAAPGEALLLTIRREGAIAEWIAVLAITPPRLGFGFARIWRCEQAALGAAMFDRDSIAAALESVLAWSRGAFPLAAGLIAPRVAPSGPFGLAAGRFAARAAAFHPIRRAALEIGPSSKGSTAPSAKRRKEWDRLERRLGERGRLEHSASADPEAVERFLALEALGWKGARGSALIGSAGRAAFAREMMASFSARGRMRVHELRLDGATLAAGVELRSGSRAFFWKIAYDEAFAAFSPGVLLTRALTRRLADGGEIDLIDSCAAPDHPMIDRLWPDRLEFVDLAISNGASPLFGALIAWERAAPKLRERAKQVILPLIGRKRS